MQYIQRRTIIDICFWITLHLFSYTTSTCIYRLLTSDLRTVGTWCNISDTYVIQYIVISGKIVGKDARISLQNNDLKLL